MGIRVTVWHEYRHEKHSEKVKGVYPEGLHTDIAAGLKAHGFEDVRLATLDDPEHGLTDEVLENTDVMTWWGHGYHKEVDDAIVQKVYDRVQAGMGLIALHSAHHAKVFRKLMGTSCNLKWRDQSVEKEILWVTKPGHPILAGVHDHLVLENEEMYGEYFEVPPPDELLMISSFSGGEVFRSAMTWQRGLGKIFFFRPGHELYPTFRNPAIQRILANAVRWCAKTEGGTVPQGCPNPQLGWI